MSTTNQTASQSRAMILAAHGSRLKSSNDEVAQLAKTLAGQLAGQFDLVSAAFLELAEPSIEQSLADAIAAGHQHITVVPYFLAAGRHVRDDVPAIVEQAQADNPDVSISLTKHLGVSPALIAAVNGLLQTTNDD